MRLTKSQLDFISVFVSSADTKTQLGNKLYIRVKNGEAVFAQYGFNAKLFKRFATESNEEFEMLVSTNIFSNFIGTIKDDEEIVLTKDGVSIKENSNYSFESFSIQFPDVDEFFRVFEDDSATEFEIKDFDALRIAKMYCGKTDDVEIISLQDNFWVSSDRLEISILKTKNETPKVGEDNIFYIPKELVAMFDKMDSVTIREYPDKNFWTFKYNDIYCVIEYRKYALPYIFGTEIKKNYDHKHKITFKTDVFRQALKRMNIFAADNQSSRIYLSIDKVFQIENRDHNVSKEQVEYEYCDSEIFGREVSISCAGLLKACQYVDTDHVSIFVSNNPENKRTIRLEDETGNYQFIITQVKDS